MIILFRAALKLAILEGIAGAILATSLLTGDAIVVESNYLRVVICFTWWVCL